MAKTLNYYLVKINRATAWLLPLFMVVFICTGFSIAGDYGFDRLIPSDVALALHKKLTWPLLALFFSHTGISAYFSFRRWGWIPTRTKP